MGSDSVLNSEVLRARITSFEYKIEKNPSPKELEEYKKEIRRIYIEETGKEPPEKIEIYSSGMPALQNSKDSGFDGTVIHFYDPKKGINQSYTITRGSETAEDVDGPPLKWIMRGLSLQVWLKMK